MNSLWLVITALAAFLVAYRYYGAFLATKVAMLDDRRVTPSHRLRDDVDYHPTKRLVLFGVHFAAIAGPGPLIGPVLASQWGYAPGFGWIVIGACLAGAVHDFVVLLASVRQDGMSLPKIARETIGPMSGVIATVATLFIVIATLAGVAIVVVNALSESSWGMFTICVTIPAALLTGLWMYKIRPGRVAEASIIGVTLVLAGVFLGQPFAETKLGDYPIVGRLIGAPNTPGELAVAPELAKSANNIRLGDYLLFDKQTLSIMLPVYAAIASILPVWVLLCPRDYLSSYMKIGVIAVLAVGIFVAHPTLKMPATTPYLSGGGPVVAGTVWPFVCIVIMCGALSGFHALIASGTTPKMLNKESDIRPIGYGGMILEGFVSLMALVAACALEPGDYFAINVPQPKAFEEQALAEAKEKGLTGGGAEAFQQRRLRQLQENHYQEFVARADADPNWNGRSLQWVHMKDTLEPETHETLLGRTGGAVTLAVGMATVFTGMMGPKLISYWYHFVIMFEALFILTLLETGTRVARFVFQETVAQFNPNFAIGGQARWGANILMSVTVCALWGYLLYTGSIESLWRMMGIANQLLAVIGLAVGTSYLLNKAPKRVYALCTAVPLAFVAVTVFAAGVQSVHTWWTHAMLPETAGDAKFIDLLNCVMATTMLVLTAAIIADALRRWYGVLRSPATQPAAAAYSAETPPAG